MKYYKFDKIAICLWQKRIQHQDAAKALDISVSCFNRKLDAQSPWTLPEMHKLTRLLGKNTLDWAELFPNLYKEEPNNGK